MSPLPHSKLLLLLLDKAHSTLFGLLPHKSTLLLRLYNSNRDETGLSLNSTINPGTHRLAPTEIGVAPLS